MSDETKMNAELEAFAASLQNVPAPEAELNRDQLMYEAGFAAAVAQADPVVVRKSRNLPALAVTFASGVAVASAVLISVMPLSTSDSDADAKVPRVAAKTARPDAEKFELVMAEQPDTRPDELLKRVQNLRPGHSINAGFGSRSIMPKLAQTESLDADDFSAPARPPQTSIELMRELAPKMRTLNRSPAWHTWLTIGDHTVLNSYDDSQFHIR